MKSVTLSVQLNILGHFSLKRKYTRIGIIDGTVLKQNYCIYCANPKNPTDPHYDLRYDKWYNEILKVSKRGPATC